MGDTLEDVRLNVTARFHEQVSALKGDKSGACDSFDISIEVDSEEPEDVIENLMNMA